ncbi:hypothetical protein NPIL_490511 [Nephila pilipes]|uniref:Uncharacterized protein n=1 Tax=Nephila pilipes TaxID=299642 RepID=A0A8X6MKY3_NEPPI|nr:hypothetical protein NPIL_490511 [Nephila pilipes]
MATEMGIKVVPNMTQLDLQKMITSSECNEEELMKEKLEGIKEDIKRREWRDQQEAKKRRDKIEFLMEEMFMFLERSQYLTGIKHNAELQKVKTQIRKLKQ